MVSTLQEAVLLGRLLCLSPFELLMAIVSLAGAQRHTYLKASSEPIATFMYVVSDDDKSSDIKPTIDSHLAADRTTAAAKTCNSLSSTAVSSPEILRGCWL